MIHTVLSGRLGNWLFQYAAGRRLADARGTDLGLSLYRQRTWRDPLAKLPQELLAHFHLRAKFTSRIPAVTSLLGWSTRERRGGRYLDFRGFGYDPDVFELPDESVLRGWFQGERWLPEAEALRPDLRFRDVPSDANVRACEDQIAKPGSVSVHVRRADYLTLPNFNVCTKAYYERAMDAARERVSNAHFVVFSDDVAWCKQQDLFRGAAVVDVPLASENPVIDLRLMSLCEHHIIANSTFSWWGQWLNPRPNKVVMTPNRWFNSEEQNAEAVRETLPTGALQIAV